MLFIYIFLFSAPNIQGRSVIRHQILTRSMVTWVYKIGSEIWGNLHKKLNVQLQTDQYRYLQEHSHVQQIALCNSSKKELKELYK